MGQIAFSLCTLVKYKAEKNADKALCKIVAIKLVININVVSFNPKKLKMIGWWPRNFSLVFIPVNLCAQPPPKYSPLEGYDPNKGKEIKKRSDFIIIQWRFLDLTV